MPLLILPIVLLLGVLLALLMLPLTLLRRYRMGTARRRAFGWVVQVNAWGWVLSVLGLLAGGAWATRWADNALLYTVAGLAAGALLGVAGIKLAHFEFTPKGLFHTPSKWLVLTVTLVLASRIAYSLWHLWQQSRLDGPVSAHWQSLMHAHVGTFAAAGLLMGYYLVYEWGVKSRLKYLSKRTI